MGAQPAGHGGGFSIRQHLHGSMCFSINKQRAIPIAFVPREIVEAQDAWDLVLRKSSAADELQERIAAGRHCKTPRQVRSCFASTREANLRERIGLPQRPPNVSVR